MNPISVILKNNSSMDIDVDLIDGYGGNFTTNVAGSTAQNQTLMEGSAITINGQTIHTVSAEDANMEITIAE
jgi:hypothetical protein